jgi:hypothetical protein
MSCPVAGLPPLAVGESVAVAPSCVAVETAVERDAVRFEQPRIPRPNPALIRSSAAGRDERIENENPGERG